MKVILLENVKRIGSIGEVIDVKRGFARNYLIANKKALYASKENIKEVEKIKTDLSKKDNEKKKEASLIAEQIKVAAGEAISGKNYYPQMHAIECRINAEDPEKDFRPSPGRITELHSPGGHGVRIDSHIYAGYMIPPYYDSMISKIITVAQTREEAITKMLRALEEYYIEGIKTTVPFHIKLLNDPKIKEGDYTTKFMETFEM